MARPKQQLGMLMRKAGDLITVSVAANTLQLSNLQAAKVLARWASQGWLTRVCRGLYAVVPLEALDNQQALENEWMLVPNLYAPAYIGGWSAAEYWELTEQLFRDVCVLTEKIIPHKTQIIHNISFSLTHIPAIIHFGTKTIWKNKQKIQISDPHKTIIDMLYDPRLGGGIQHVIDCFKEYGKSSHYNPSRLINYAEKFNNGAILKRLGFLASMLLQTDHQLTDYCRQHLTKGLSYLDPSIKKGRLITNWRLYVPEHLQFME